MSALIGSDDMCRMNFYYKSIHLREFILRNASLRR
jgi:hypothetical protein